MRHFDIRGLAAAMALFALVIGTTGCAENGATFRSKLGTNRAVGTAATGSVTATAVAPGTSSTSSGSSAGAGSRGTAGSVATDVGSTSKQGAGATGTSLASKSDAAQPGAGSLPGTAPGVSLAVNFVNGTDSRPVKGTVVEIGEVAFKPDTGGRSDRGVLRPVPAGENVALSVYPDGRFGKRIAVPLSIEESADPARPTSVVYITVSDDRVQVRGALAGGLETRVFPRR